MARMSANSKLLRLVLYDNGKTCVMFFFRLVGRQNTYEVMIAMKVKYYIRKLASIAADLRCLNRGALPGIIWGVDATIVTLKP